MATSARLTRSDSLESARPAQADVTDNLKGDPRMCFAEPGRISSIDGPIARIITAEGTREASLRIIEAEGRSVEVGDWVLLSLGLVVAVVDDRDGEALFREMQNVRAEWAR